MPYVAFERFGRQFGTLSGIITSFYGSFPMYPASGLPPTRPRPPSTAKQPAITGSQNSSFTFGGPLVVVGFSSDKIELNAYFAHLEGCGLARLSVGGPLSPSFLPRSRRVRLVPFVGACLPLE